MKWYLACLFLTILAMPLESSTFNYYVGPHFNYTRIKFDESDHIDGYLGGVTAGFEYRRSCFVGSFDFEGSWDTNYLRGDPCQKSSIEEYFIELKVGTQYARCCKRVMISPYIGFGWDRLINDQLPHAFSLCYRYDKLFIPVGVHFTYCVSSQIKSGLQFEWRPDVYSALHINSTKVDNDCEHAFRVQMPFKYCFCSPCCNGAVSLIPFFDWSRYGHSDEKNSVGVSLGVPRLIRWSLGLRILIGSNF